jgi:hypothetical protein
MVGLLDVNVLVALSWPEHEAFARSHRWFARHAAGGWASCPITQAGFVRVVSNPAFSMLTITPREALANLTITMKHSGHHFWRDDISLQQATEPFAARMVGHHQITDAYLLGLAIHHKGKLITLDRATLSLLPDNTFSGHLDVLDA